MQVYTIWEECTILILEQQKNLFSMFALGGSFQDLKPVCCGERVRGVDLVKFHFGPPRKLLKTREMSQDPFPPLLRHQSKAQTFGVFSFSVKSQDDALFF